MRSRRPTSTPPSCSSRACKSIVVLLHQGGIPASPAFNYDCNANGGLGLTGDIVPIAQQISPAVDLIITGHTHTAYTCNIPDPAGNPRMVTSASSFGRLFTDIELQYDPATRDIVRSSVTAHELPVTRDVAEGAGRDRDHQPLQHLPRPDRQHRRRIHRRHDPGSRLHRVGRLHASRVRRRRATSSPTPSSRA